MQNIRWYNQGHPQTLGIGVILLYIDGVFAVLGGALSSSLGLLIAIASVAAAVGIANDKRAAWYLGVAVSAIYPLLLLWLIYRGGLDQIFDSNLVLSAIFPIAQFAALIHPMSRSFVNVYFE